ncbi:A/G-specific adenine glycosylase [Buchnera aphidicola (Aphis craccivora)]|uniref:Adenine DNA glycosylase n=1 Tax=Buchnera aphidicola (Aphis craccivora) TaxID=466616 RepID=A0A4D6XVB6_9GAMM|nr:A/G-specific adenine glycosylase [Buchnera aphidicola]QCI16775.1 A/G-specific adenine glycosylase [Buchnera aphidicola (Aphis craccivora)]QLL40907.1 A/G-specific adenine glycosylase [Buchnera aphidicola (Aphis craccivore)]WAI17748.1 MAG: A/G-specific adenine glycosylase [Buchnera aphidicola (Aphis craccivora)]
MTLHIFSQLVLNWYHLNGRKNLPWQRDKTLYRVWISEIMLQQTQVKTVIPYFKKFISKFPNLNSLNNGTLNEILYLWSGLGYYKRAKNIYETAKIIKNKFNGKFPKNILDLVKLPGIGKSTAGAILSFTLNYFFSILDGNVKRILIRYYGISECLKNTKTEKKLWNLIENITPIHNTGAFNQGIIDIGALICTSKIPKCNICPLNTKCIAYKEKEWKKYSFQKNTIKKIKKKYWFVIIYFQNTIWMQKNTIKNIWNNLFYFPSFEKKNDAIQWMKKNQINVKNIKEMNSFCHEFSHFTMYANPILIKLFFKHNCFNTKKQGIWYNLNKPQKIGLPKLVEKILKLLI